jgi:hypothetical protein
MKSVVNLLLIVLLVSFCPPQNESRYTLLTHILSKVKNITTDNLGNLYVLTNGNQLNKYGRNGALIGTLNYNYTGNITQVDASNPMQVFLFYRELNKVIILDNNLAYRGEINLTKAGIIQAAAVARAYDNNLWVFDVGDLQLKKINRDSEVEQSSGNVRQYILNNTAVNYLFDNGDRVFVVDANNGILLFDVFASYQKTIPIKGVNEVKVLDRFLFYYAAQKLNRYNWQTSQEQSYALPDTSGVIRLSVEKERIYLQKQDTISIYSF